MFIAINKNLVFALYFLKMVGVQELLRIRVVQFFKRMMRTDPGWKLTTVQHLVAEGVTKSTIYRIIARYRATGTKKVLEGRGGS